jgi:hypothetical protein
LDDEVRLLATTDGGAVWVPASIPPLHSPDFLPWPDIVRFVTDKVGFVFSTEDENAQSGDLENQKAFYTTDGGVRWQKYSLPYAIYRCQALDRDLICGADRKDSRFGVLTIHPK